MKYPSLRWLLVGALLLVFPQTSTVEAQQQRPGNEAEGKTYTHIVQRGDTLWDICEQLYGNPWVWPKVWQLNEHITNPHWIYPGTKLEVYYQLPTSLAARPAAEQVTLAPQPPLPSIPPKAAGIEFSEIDQVGFITPSPPPSVGLIAGEINEKMLIAVNDEVFVQFHELGQTYVGERYFIFTTSDLIRHPVTDRGVGYLNTILGILEVAEIAPNHAKAVVITSYDTIAAGDKLMPYRKRSEEITFRQGTEPKEGSIILSEGEKFLMGEDQIVFIDLGENDNILTGYRFEVYRHAKAKDLLTGGDSELIIRKQPIGELLVLAVEKETAAALVTESKTEFLPGAPVRLKTTN